MTATTPDVDQICRALNQSLSRNAAYARLVGGIYYRMTASNITSGDAVLQTLQLLREFFAGSSASVGDGSPPAEVGTEFRPPARSVPAGNGHRPGADLPVRDMVTGTVDYASRLRVGWSG